jgi:hypothetical protein
MKKKDISKSVYASTGIPKNGGTTLKKELEHLKKHPLSKTKHKIYEII